MTVFVMLAKCAPVFQQQQDDVEIPKVLANIEVDDTIQLNKRPVYTNLFMWLPALTPCEDGYRPDEHGICREIWDSEE